MRKCTRVKKYDLRAAAIRLSPLMRSLSNCVVLVAEVLSSKKQMKCESSSERAEQKSEDRGSDHLALQLGRRLAQ